MKSGPLFASIVLLCMSISVCAQEKETKEIILEKDDGASSKNTTISGYQKKDPGLFIAWSEADFDKVTSMISSAGQIYEFVHYKEKYVYFFVFAGNSGAHHSVEVDKLFVSRIGNKIFLRMIASFHFPPNYNLIDVPPESPWAMVKVPRAELLGDDDISPSKSIIRRKNNRKSFHGTSLFITITYSHILFGDIFISREKIDLF